MCDGRAQPGCQAAEPPINTTPTTQLLHYILIYQAQPPQAVVDVSITDSVISFPAARYRTRAGYTSSECVGAGSPGTGVLCDKVLRLAK